MSIKLLKKIIITGTIETKTGLMIGSATSALAIGDIDKYVIRDPITNYPYIPGSSLKGKMRSLLELAYGLVVDNGSKNPKQVRYTVSDKGVTSILFGNAQGTETQRPSRIIVRDAILSESGIKKLSALKTDAPFTEIKTEVTIDRITSVASPRTFERVPAGVEFDFNIVLNVFDKDKEFKDADGKVYDEQRFVKEIFSSLKLLQNDYLGGSGSRGYGQIQFHLDSIKERTAESYLQEDAKDEEYKLVQIPEELK